MQGKSKNDPKSIPSVGFIAFVEAIVISQSNQGTFQVPSKRLPVLILMLLVLLLDCMPQPVAA